MLRYLRRLFRAPVHIERSRSENAAAVRLLIARMREINEKLDAVLERLDRSEL